MRFDFSQERIKSINRLSLELWLKVEASRRRNDPRKVTLVTEHGAALE